MKSLKRSSRCESSWATRPDRAWLRTLSQVVMPEVRPPTKDPASADSAERYAASCIYDYYESRHSHYFDSKQPWSHPPSFLRVLRRVADSTLFQVVGLRCGPKVSAQEPRGVPRSRIPDS